MDPVRIFQAGEPGNKVADHVVGRDLGLGFKPGGVGGVEPLGRIEEYRRGVGRHGSGNPVRPQTPVAVTGKISFRIRFLNPLTKLKNLRILRNVVDD